ncbi:MAG TPA: phosphate ABC transporter substrate-binding protein [Burkholderiales bacterium]|nr:phosphate ABC transporter substrate-binding protein [Burkholderiales bacterium]
MKLAALLGDYPVTRALKAGEVRSSRVALEFAADVATPSSAFKRVVREAAFDVAELALVTYLMAKERGAPLVLLPAVVLARFQHPLLMRAAARGPLAPKELEGRRVGVRSWSVTTGMWMRSILAEDHGVDVRRVQWVTFEEPHVADFRDPPNVERAPQGKDMVEMLVAGELDAAIATERSLGDARLAPVIPDPAGAARAWQARHGGIQINHMVVVRSALTRSDADSVREVYRLLAESRRVAGNPELNPFGCAANRRNLELAIERTHAQGLIARRFAVEELYDETTGALQ